VLEKPISTVLSFKNFGKLVPEIVKLSEPKTFKFSFGVIAVTVHSTGSFYTEASTGIKPKSENTSGIQSPHTGASFRMHSIFVSLEDVA
jgi:hypothetical protein